MKVLMTILLVLCTVVGVAHGADDPVAIKCHVGDDAAGAKALAETACEAAVTECSGPTLKTDFSGDYEEGGFACGACEDAQSTTCATCEGEGCNDPANVLAYTCAAITFTAKEGEVAASYTTAEKPTDCVIAAGEGVEAKCNTHPAEGDPIADYAQVAGGCGACAEDATNCLTVNGAAAVTAFLLPLIALVYTLF